jgi:iron complex outermembrane receptor protein
MRRSFFVFIFFAFVIFEAIPVFAAENNLPSLTIYARQRPEENQTVPLSSTVINKKEIEANHLDNPTALARDTIGFSFNNPFGRYNASPSMRGMVQPGIGEETTVAFFQDGVYVSGRSAVDMLSFDLDRIEVARGPQNALFGRNSFAGAINYITRLPSDERRVQLEQSVGTFGRLTSLAAIEGAIVPGKFQARIAATHLERGGFYGNNASDTNIGGEQSDALRLVLRLIPDEKTSVIVRTGVNSDEDDQPKSFLVAANCQPRISDGALRQYCGDLPHGDDDLAADNLRDYGFSREAYRNSINIDRTIDDDKLLQIVTAYNTEKSTFVRDDDFSASFAQVSGQRTDRADYNIDIRLRSDKGMSDWKWLVGGSLYRFENLTKRLDQAVVSGQTGPSGARNDNLTQSAAFYGSVSHPIMWGVEGTVDARVQSEEK